MRLVAERNSPGLKNAFEKYRELWRDRIQNFGEVQLIVLHGRKPPKRTMRTCFYPIEIKQDTDIYFFPQKLDFGILFAV